MRFLDYVTINPPVQLVKDAVYPFVEMANVSTTYREPDAIEYKAFSSGVRFADGDTVIARIEPCLQNGKRFFVHNIGQGFGSTEFLVFRSKDKKIDEQFLYYLMQTEGIRKLMINSMTGATGRQRVNNDIFADMEFDFPDLPTQHRIASILSAYDDLIENNRRQIKLLEEAAQRLYREWFVELRFPGHEDVKIVDGVPEGWKVMSMNDIAEYVNGYAFKPSDWGSKGKPIIKIKEMGAGVTTDTPRNSGEGILEKYIVTSGDILFSWSATLSAVIWDQEDGLLNQHLFKVVPSGNIAREFVFQSILHTLNEFYNLTTGSTMKHIQRGKLNEVFVNVPDYGIMKKYESVSSPMREEILILRKRMTLLREARDRLIPKMMSGEREV